MKTAEDKFNEIHDLEAIYFLDEYSMPSFLALREKIIGMLEGYDKEGTQKIQTALDKTGNWNCTEVLTKLLED